MALVILVCSEQSAGDGEQQAHRLAIVPFRYDGDKIDAKPGATRRGRRRARVIWVHQCDDRRLALEKSFAGSQIRRHTPRPF
jgi:hypothetical protein